MTPMFKTTLKKASMKLMVLARIFKILRC